MADATSILNEISGGLDALGAQAVNMISDDRAFLEMWGWNLPVMNRHEFAEYIRSPREVIQRVDPMSVADVDLDRLNAIPNKIVMVRDNTIPNMAGGNANLAYTVVDSLIQSINGILAKYDDPPFSVQMLSDKNILPAKQIAQLKKMDNAIRRLGFESEAFAAKVAAIRNAHEVAEALPADVQSLEDARARYEAARDELTTMVQRATASQGEIETIRANMAQANAEAGKVVERANKAYSAATTVGLGQAFAERAKSLTISTYVLGGVLILALSVGATITFFRVRRVQELIALPDINFDVLWVNVTLTGLSVSAPVWLAWLVTRQIGQRFRLAEDYSYKASVAKAYEGYRAEASYIDPELTKRLFGIALDRLGEAPLRLVEKESPGSPTHELQGPVGWLLGRRREKPTTTEGGEG